MKHSQVILTEVGPRDGLQNEPLFVETPYKIEFINQLSSSGLKNIEVTSFVSPKKIPQLSDNELVYKAINKPEHVRFSALVPNKEGMQKALASGVQSIAVFTSASETFNQHNINSSIAQSLEKCAEVVSLAKASKMHVRAYISCALGCPFEGQIQPREVVSVAQALLEMSVDEISFGDTIGVGTPKQTKELIYVIQSIMPMQQVAMHFHDTYGQAIANIVTSLESGIRHFDSSTAGLGGCPYAQGATGNVATEDVLYLMHGLGLETGVDIYKVVAAGHQLCKMLKRTNQSKVANALLGRIQK